MPKHLFDLDQFLEEREMTNAEIVHEIKQRWFHLAVQEDYPKTPDISEQLDLLEKYIAHLSNLKD